MARGRIDGAVPARLDVDGVLAHVPVPQPGAVLNIPTLAGLAAGLAAALICTLTALLSARHHDQPPARIRPPTVTTAPLPDLPANMPWCGPGVTIACRVPVTT
jgi:hypothetical protein